MPNLAELLGQLSVFAKLTMAVPIVSFGLAVTYVFRPTEQKLVLMRPVSLAAIFATVSGLLGGWIALLASIPATPDGHLPVASLYQGIAESLTVGLVSFGLLAAAWMLVAVGVLRRQAAW
jgi:type IV secretory pathway protease TraF